MLLFNVTAKRASKKDPMVCCTEKLDIRLATDPLELVLIITTVHTLVPSTHLPLSSTLLGQCFHPR